MIFAQGKSKQNGKITDLALRTNSATAEILNSLWIEQLPEYTCNKD